MAESPQPECMRRRYWRRRAVERPGCAWRWASGAVLCLLGVFVGPTAPFSGAWNVCPPPARPAACSTGVACRTLAGAFAQTPEVRSARGPGYSPGCWTPPRKRCLPLLRLQLTSAAGAAAESRMPQVIGHRGAKSVAPENTLASVRAAHALGCSWVEVDVMLSKDKVAVIHHDNTLDRCTNGAGRLWDCTADQLEALDAGSHFSSDFAGEKIPRLTALLECCHELQLGLNLEVKHVSHNPDAPTAEDEIMEEELAHAVSDILESWEKQPRELVLSSFSRCSIAVLRRRLPQVACGFLVWDIPDDWEAFMARHSCASLNFAWQGPGTPRHRIRECAQKVPCYSYTINAVEEAQELLSLGVKGVFSDCPHVVAAGLKQAPAVTAPDEQDASSVMQVDKDGGQMSSELQRGRKTVGVDYGRKRTGVCVSVGYAPRPLPLISHDDDAQAVALQVGRLARKEGAEQIVVGLPYNSTGGEGEQAACTRAFVSRLQDACPHCAILLWDERFSTAVAREKLREVGYSRFDIKDMLDTAAAIGILTDFFEKNGEGAEVVQRARPGGDSERSARALVPVLSYKERLEQMKAAAAGADAQGMAGKKKKKKAKRRK